LAFLVVLVLDFPSLFEDEDENEEDSKIRVCGQTLIKTVAAYQARTAAVLETSRSA
jgi:hypothetical protein